MTRSDPTEMKLDTELIDDGFNSLPNPIEIPPELWRIFKDSISFAF